MGRATKLLRWLAPISIWLPRALWECARVIRNEKPDALLTSGPPHDVHLVGALLRRRFNIPWVADFRDPWVTYGVPTPNRPLWSRLEPAFERAVFGRADAIVANTPSVRAALETAYPAQARKMVAITNGYDPEAFGDPTPVPSGNPNPSIVHSGVLYAGRDPRPFLDALASLNGEDGGDRVGARFLGRAEQSEFELGAEIQRRGLSSLVTVEGQLPYRQALRVTTEADILLLLDTPGRRLGVPAKLYEYLGARRPILALAERGGDVEWVLKQSGVPFRIVPPADASGVRRALAELIPEGRRWAQHGRGGAVARPFTRESTASQLAGVLDRHRPPSRQG
jgi:glycosyltransferase involved in cell wall biosynthesis